MSEISRRNARRRSLGESLPGLGKLLAGRRASSGTDLHSHISSAALLGDPQLWRALASGLVDPTKHSAPKHYPAPDRHAFSVPITLPQGFTRRVRVARGVSVREALVGLVMEYQLTSYRVHLASSKAILPLDSDSDLLEGQEITLEDTSGENFQPHLVYDSRLRITYTLLKSEKSFQESLRSIFDVYAEPLRKFSSLTTEDHRVLFFGLEPLLSLSAMLCLKLEDTIESWDPGTSRVGSLFSKQFWHHYEEYYHGHKAIRVLLKEKRENDEEFIQFCLLRRVAAKDSLESLLLLPVQRIPSYDGFLTDLLAETDESHPDYEDLCKAASKLQNILKERQEDVSDIENEYRVDSVQDRFPQDNLQLCEKKMKSLQARRRSAPGAVIFRGLGSKKHGSSSGLGSSSSFMPDAANASRPGGLTSTQRIYILEGPAQLTTGLQTQDRYLFLFNDLLLIAKQKSSTTFKLKHRVRVCEMWTGTCVDDVSEATHSLDRSFVMGWPMTNTVATFATPDLKDHWLAKLTEQIDGEKDKEEPKTIMLKVQNKDMDGCANSKMIPVGNKVEACTVVKQCMEEFHISEGEVKDYQLWVVSGKEDSPYPLIGHEHPFSIKMSHLRDAIQMRGGSLDDVTIPMDMETNDAAAQCQFILRQSKKAPNKHSLEDTGNKRAKKSKKSPLMNFFKKQKHAHSRHPAQVGGKLFGHPLPDICEGDSIPKPVMEMLHFLFLNGPFTPGIFRKSANHRICKELREKLDAEGEVQCEDKPVHVIAATLKDFLRSLPESLFMCDLYDQWTEVEDVQEDAEKIPRIQRTLAQLPTCHVILIQHLMCILHHVEQHSEDNNMNAFNLAICIGQSLLWPPESKGPAAQAIATKSVPLFIQYLIEHVTFIFGEECVKLFGEPPTPESKPRQDSGTDSDSMHSLLSIPDHPGMVHRDNSSIDSLERELYSEMECSPRLLKSQLSTTNLSRDSGLTLSDNQLYEDNESEMSSLASQTHRGQYLGRSVSQMEEAKGDLDPGKLSSSHEGALNLETPPPVPPPRKSKRRGSEPHEHIMMGELSSSPLSRQVMLKHSNSAASDLRRQLKHLPLSKRVSNESLGSLDEDPELRAKDINTARQRQRDIGVLRKSASGAHLYVNEELLHGDVVGEEMDESLDVRRRKDRQASKDSNRDSGLSATSPHRHSWGELLRDDSLDEGGECITSQPMSTGSIDLDPRCVNYVCPSSYAKARFMMSPPDSPDTESTDKMVVPHFPMPTTSAHEAALHASTIDSHAGSKLMDHSYARDSRDSGVAEEESPPPRPPKLGLIGTSSSLGDSPFAEENMPCDSPGKGWEMESVGSASFVGSPPPKVLLRSAMNDPEKHFTFRKARAGMTAKGADMFPKQIRSVLRNSVHEDDFRQMLGDNVDGLQKLGEGKSEQSGEKPIVRLQRQKAIERSASDTRLSDHSHHSSSPTSVTGQGHNDWKRPDKPPSYQEAIQRKSLLKSGMPIYNISEKDIMEQKMHGARARQLYEESMKRYMESETSESEQSDNPVDSKSDSLSAQQAVPCKSPPPYQRPQEGKSEQSRRNSQPHAARQSPEKSTVCDKVSPAKQKGTSREPSSDHRKDKTPPREVLHRSDSGSKSHNGDQDRTPSREARSLKVHDQPRSKSEGRSHRREKTPSRSRDRSRGHRLSDTRLENSRNRERGSNLCRSKSDSSEHINKIGKFKELKPLDDNVWDKYRKSRSQSDSSSGLEEVFSRQRRRSANSMKHRDWHKDLAEQYSKVFYQPSQEQKPSQPPLQYSYVRPAKQESVEGDKGRRRWMPPVHPSKDLIVTSGHNNHSSHGSKEQRRRNVVTRTNSKPELVQNEVQSDSQRSDASDKENRPSREKSVEETSHHSSEPDAPEEEVMFTVSVKQLRNLWDNPHPKEAKAAHNQKDGQRPPNPPPYRNPPPIKKQGDVKKRWPVAAGEKNEESYV